MKFLSDFHVRDVLKGGAQALSLKVLASLIGFLVSITLGRFYGPQGMGVYALMLSTILIAATLAAAGLDNAVIKFVSGGRAKNDTVGASQTLKTAMFMVLSMSLVMAIFIYFSRNFIAVYILGNENVAPLLAIASAGIVAMALSRICAAGLKALDNIPAAHIAEGVALPSGILIVFLLTKGDAVDRAAFSYLSGAILAVCVGLFFLFITAKAIKFTNVPTNLVVAKKLWNMGWPTLGIVLGVYATEVLATVILSHFSTVEDVGRFRIAWQIAFLVSFLTMATDSIMSPKISALFVKRELIALAKVLRFNILLIALFSVPAAFVIIFFSAFILSFFGGGFEEAAPILTILVFGQIINGTLGTAGKVLIMTGHEKKSLINSFVGVIVILLASWVLVPQYGGVGAAMAVAITMSVRCVSAMILVRIYLGINMLTGKSYLEIQRTKND